MNDPMHTQGTAFMPDAPSRIGVSTHIAVHRWTWENFLRYVQYEAMFYDKCVRVEPLTRRETRARFMMLRTGPGHNGFPTDVTQTMVLFDVDGDLPAFAFDPTEGNDLAHNGDAASAHRAERYAAE